MAEVGSGAPSPTGPVERSSSKPPPDRRSVPRGTRRRGSDRCRRPSASRAGSPVDRTTLRPVHALAQRDRISVRVHELGVQVGRPLSRRGIRSPGSSSWHTHPPRTRSTPRSGPPDRRPRDRMRTSTRHRRARLPTRGRAVGTRSLRPVLGLGGEREHVEQPRTPILILPGRTEVLRRRLEGALDLVGRPPGGRFESQRDRTGGERRRHRRATVHDSRSPCSRSRP